MNVNLGETLKLTIVWSRITLGTLFEHVAKTPEKRENASVQSTHLMFSL